MQSGEGIGLLVSRPGPIALHIHCLPLLHVSRLDPSNRHSFPTNVQHVISSSGSHTCLTSADRIDPADNTIKWLSLHRATRWRPTRR
jgi:hypothetical protein